MDHDQRFKVLLREFPHEFFKLFFPGVARQFDFSRLEWLETELFPDPPEGERRAVDLVAKLPLKRNHPTDPETDEAPALLALIHIEIESSESPADFGRRMMWYYMSLRQRHNLPVLPVVVFLQQGKIGLGRERHIERCGRVKVVQFEYLTVGLRRLESVQYLKKSNPLAPALSALMHVPDGQRAEIKLEAYEQIVRSRTNRYQQFLLLNCVDAYLQLDETDAAEFDRLLATRSEGETRKMILTSFEQRELLGREKERRHMVLLLLQERFSPIPDFVRQRVSGMSLEDLESVFLRLIRGASLEEVGLAADTLNQSGDE